jgi:hypothetical protein
MSDALILGRGQIPMSGLRSLLVIGTLSFATVASCARNGRPLNEKLQTALDARLRHCDVKGASVAVILPDGALWRGASGISHPGVNMNPQMAFAIGSITKNMVAALRLLAGSGVAMSGVRRDKRMHLLVFGGLAIVAGWISVSKWSPLEFVLFPVGGVAVTLGPVLLI